MVSHQSSILSPAQDEVLKFIERFIARHGMPPTRGDVAAERGCGRANADQHLRALQKKGVLKLLPRQSRGIQLLASAPKAAAANLLPLIGTVAAGPPILSLEDADDYLLIDPKLFKPKASYLRRVSGNSMIDMGIQDGDLIGVHPSPVADQGQIIVAKLFPVSGPEITVKKYRREGNIVRLIPMNDRVPEIVVDLRRQEFEIEGLYCGHIHRGF